MKLTHPHRLALVLLVFSGHAATWVEGGCTEFSLSYSVSFSPEEAENSATFDAWATAAQEIPVAPEKYCSFYSSNAHILGPESEVVQQPDISQLNCVKNIGELFDSSTQKFSDATEAIWITPRDVLIGATLTWCSKPCAVFGGEVACGTPIKGASLLTRFNGSGEIREQQWFYDSREIEAVQCPV